jgi:predicted TIM-barrel fold metal-dependent hydrolase
MIVDNHVHIAGTPHNDEPLTFPAYDGKNIPSMPPNMPRETCSPTRLIQDMDKYNIDKAIIVALEGWVTNQQLSEAVKQYPDRLIGYAKVTNPLDKETAPKELEHAVKHLGLRGLKLHPGLQGFSPADPRLFPLVEKAAELDAPIFFHTGGWPYGSYDYCNPSHIDALSYNVPDACIIIGHMGFYRFMDVLALIQLYAGTGGLYVDTSMGLFTLVDMYGLKFMSKYVKRIGIDKVLFGSDWSGYSQRMEKDNLDVIEKLDLTREEKNKILGGNISKILNL